MVRNRRILVLYGHPDPSPERFLRALAASYQAGAQAGGHELRLLALSALDIPPLRGSDEFHSPVTAADVRRCQEALVWADHLVILFPLWLGDMPGQLKQLLEQVLRPDFAFAASRGRGLPRKLLKGRSARIIVTMGMPALFYRWYYRAHSVKNLERNILAFCGFGPVRKTMMGMVEGISDSARAQWLAKVEALGRRAA